MRTVMKISGGLGNQLFQYAAALLFASGEKLELDISNYSSHQSPRDLSLKRYHLPPNVEFLTSKRDLLDIKLENLAMRLSCANNLGFYRRLSYNFTNLVIAKMLRNRSSVDALKISKDVGWDSSLRARDSRKTKFYGYFQSYMLIPPGFNLELNPDLITSAEAEYLAQIIEASNQELPLVVHLRFGDYFENKVFKEMSLAYYKAAIEFQMQTGLYKSIWLFSDDPHRAKSYIPIKFAGLVLTKEEANLDPAVTLEAMRFGKGYVLANSTFSWWGAWLSYTNNPIVIAPTFWFKSWKIPERLIPDEWIRFDNH